MSNHEDGVLCLECEARVAITRLILNRANDALGDLAHELLTDQEHGWEFAFAFANGFVNRVHDEFDAFINDDIIQACLARGKKPAKRKARKVAT